MGMSGQCHGLATLPPAKARYPLCKSMGGPHGRSWCMRNILPPTGFNPCNDQPIVSCYTDYAILAYVAVMKTNTNCSSDTVSEHHLSNRTVAVKGLKSNEGHNYLNSVTQNSMHDPNLGQYVAVWYRSCWSHAVWDTITYYDVDGQMLYKQFHHQYKYHIKNPSMEFSLHPSKLQFFMSTCHVVFHLVQHQ
jgi:hypothetical protein